MNLDCFRWILDSGLSNQRIWLQIWIGNFSNLLPLITDEGKRLLGNTAIGCVAGEILFGECEKGAAVGAGATIISDQK